MTEISKFKNSPSTVNDSNLYQRINRHYEYNQKPPSNKNVFTFTKVK